MIVVSQTPVEALVREWKENKIDHFVGFIAGQEHGTKTEHIKYSAEGKYDKSKILMVGDAPGDYKAAKANGALFFPIIPGDEEASWAELGGEGLKRFFAGSFAGAYQEKLLAAFDKALPSLPSWPQL
jgi:phosphoglycolate phosphatase-like HAD superfamily hydrolase